MKRGGGSVGKVGEEASIGKVGEASIGKVRGGD